jgi:hypothetical protein
MTLKAPPPAAAARVPAGVVGRRLNSKSAATALAANRFRPVEVQLLQRIVSNTSASAASPGGMAGLRQRTKAKRLLGPCLALMPNGLSQNGYGQKNKKTNRRFPAGPKTMN